MNHSDVLTILVAICVTYITYTANLLHIGLITRECMQSSYIFRTENRLLTTKDLTL
jgi:hypothetical protein